MGVWRVIVIDALHRRETYYYQESDDTQRNAALRAQAERWMASHGR
jgi:hypothetical protein